MPPRAAPPAMAGTLPVATLLIAGGGFLDSYAWLAHGHVFTNAISGNIILFGVFAAEGQWPQALRHVPPTLAFFAGVIAAQGLRQSQRSRPHGTGGGQSRAPVLSLCVEIAALPTAAMPALENTKRE